MPVICQPLQGKNPCHVELSLPVCVLPPCSVWAALFPAARVFRKTGFQASERASFHLLVKGDSSHLLAAVCQNVALEQEEVMAPGMKPGSPWAYTQPEQLL